MYRKTITALIVVCLILTMGLLSVSIAFGITNKNAKAENDTLSNNLENVYKRNYYELSYELSTVGDSLNKLLISSTPSYQQKLLLDIGEDCASAVTCLSTLSETYDTGEKTMAFINKTGDYAKSLNHKLSQGKMLSEDDKNNLTAIYESISTINSKLAEMSDEIEKNYNFLKAIESDSDAIQNFLSNAEIDIKYPSLIYDGPFTDALEEQTPSLTGETLDKEQAKQSAISYLPFDSNVEFYAETSGTLPTFIFSAESNGVSYYITVAQKGGWLVSLTSEARADENNYGEEYAVEVASAYLTKIGLSDLEAVWVSDYNSIYYINFVYKTQDTLIYPDMIKVKVSAKDKSIVGVETMNYIYNHKERTLDNPVLTKEQAEKKSDILTVETVRLAVIPVDGGKEKLCWEVAGKTNEDYYFVYYSADNGEEINVFRVVDSEQGKLLI